MFLKPWHFLFPFPHAAHRPRPAAPRPAPHLPARPFRPDPFRPGFRSPPPPPERGPPPPGSARSGVGPVPPRGKHGQSLPRALRVPGTEGGDPALSRELKATPRRRAALTYRSGQLLPGLRHLHGDIRSTAGPLGGPGAWRGGPGRAGPGGTGGGCGRGAPEARGADGRLPPAARCCLRARRGSARSEPPPARSITFTALSGGESCPRPPAAGPPRGAPRRPAPGPPRRAGPAVYLCLGSNWALKGQLVPPPQPPALPEVTFPPRGPRRPAPLAVPRGADTPTRPRRAPRSPERAPRRRRKPPKDPIAEPREQPRPQVTLPPEGPRPAHRGHPTAAPSSPGCAF